MKMPPPLPQHRPKSSWPALVVSIAAYPGLGQLMQRRWVVGGILTAVTTFAGGWLMEAMVAGTWQNVKQGWETGQSDFSAYLAAIARPARLFAAVWLVSTVDVLVAHLRLRRTPKSPA